MFSPDFSSKQLRNLGVYDEIYGDKPQQASMKSWPKHWIHPQDPKGWLQWFERRRLALRNWAIDAEKLLANESNA